MKIKISYKTADILDWIFTIIFTVLAFWADWRIGLAFLAYDISTVFSDIKDEIRREKSEKNGEKREGKKRPRQSWIERNTKG